MNVLLIGGTMRRQTTYHIARALAENLTEGDHIEELFLPEACPQFCTGCGICVMQSEEKCPHHASVHAIEQAMNRADVLIFATPTYVMHTSGQMKTMLDHFAHRFMVHRPNPEMFSKQAVVISTAAGGGTKSATKDIADSLLYWGVPRVYRYGKNVAAMGWEHVSDKKRAKITADMRALAGKIKSAHGRVKPSIPSRGLFYAMRMFHKMGMMEVDDQYWKQMGWLDGKRPWKS